MRNLRRESLKLGAGWFYSKSWLSLERKQCHNTGWVLRLRCTLRTWEVLGSLCMSTLTRTWSSTLILLTIHLHVAGCSQRLLVATLTSLIALEKRRRNWGFSIRLFKRQELEVGIWWYCLSHSLLLKSTLGSSLWLWGRQIKENP